jgi:hypothetical protein
MKWNEKYRIQNTVHVWKMDDFDRYYKWVTQFEGLDIARAHIIIYALFVMQKVSTWTLVEGR